MQQVLLPPDVAPGPSGLRWVAQHVAPVSGAHGMPAIFAWLKQYRVALQDSLFQGALR